MAILVFLGVMFGIILGQFLNYFGIELVSMHSVILILVNSWYLESESIDALVRIVVFIVSIRTGYFLGLVAESIRSAAERSKAHRLGSQDETRPKGLSPPRAGNTLHKFTHARGLRRSGRGTASKASIVSAI
jgi:hypothetical protein